MKKFEEYYNEALNAAFQGWDFSWVKDRMIEESPSWNYRNLVIDAINGIDSLLDIDTGGGEFLSSLRDYLPIYTCATEDYGPNIPVAESNLKPLGVEVLQRDNELIPYADNTFDLVINRHGSYIEEEIFRVLKSGGKYITQQVGPENMIALNQFLAPESVNHIDATWTVAKLATQLEQTGFQLQYYKNDFTPAYFTDIGAVVYYLKAISWQIEGESVENLKPRLEVLHELIEAQGKFELQSQRYLLIAVKP